MAAAESHAAKNDLWGRNLAEAIPQEIPILRPVLSGGFHNVAIDFQQSANTSRT